MSNYEIEPALTDAESNPWYLLATLHGPGGLTTPEIQNQNRVTWNRYHASLWTSQDRERLNGLIIDQEMVPFNENELIEIERLYKIRSGKEMIKPPKADGSSFEHCEFLNEVNFSGYVFKDAYFKGSVFSEISIFSRAIFVGTVDFENCMFSNIVSFYKANFLFVAKFDNANFYEQAIFSNINCHREIDFVGTNFHDRVNFINAEMKSSTDFSNCRFEKFPPQFHGAKAHEDTIWRKVSWPRPPTNPESAGVFTDAYERLKLEMDRLKKHEDELRFFAKELECRRVAAGRLKGLPIAAYGWFCDYGQSYLKPLVWMFGLFSAGVPALNFLQPDLGWGKAAGLSVANCLAGLGMRKELMGKAVESLGTGALIVSGIQMVLGLILLFLTGLGLRNRFRMK